CAIGDPPGTEACCHQIALARSVRPADEGRGVNRPVVLVDPAVLWRASSEVALQPVRKPRDLPALLPAVAGLEASPGCDSIDLAIMTIGSQGTARRRRRGIDAPRHGAYVRSDEVLRLREGPGAGSAGHPR